MNGRIGQQLGNYRLIHRLGSGGFAEVYLGEHVYLKTQAAIKVLPMQLTSDEIENFSKTLAKDPKQRFATIHEFALALEEACQRENSENRTLQLVSAGHAAIPLAASLVERERTPPMVATPPQDSSVIWNVPYRRNPFFTGRENILASLHEKLHAGKAMSQIQAISGLGGSGKTQIAIEYAYRHHSDYSVILWLRGDRRDMLREDCTTIASQLSFKGKSDDFTVTSGR